MFDLQVGCPANYFDSVLPVWEPDHTGTGILLGRAATTIPSTLVAAESSILPLGNDAGITGHLYATNIVPGVSFDVASENGADAGAFRWFIVGDAVFTENGG